VSALVLASAARALASRSNELEKRSPHVVRPHLAACSPWPAHGRRLPALDPKLTTASVRSHGARKKIPKIAATAAKTTTAVVGVRIAGPRLTVKPLLIALKKQKPSRRNLSNIYSVWKRR
jgi:hypothetical protein